MYSGSLSGSDDLVLFDSLDGKVLFSKCFMRYFNFVQVQFTTLNGNPAIVKVF